MKIRSAAAIVAIVLGTAAAAHAGQTTVWPDQYLPNYVGSGSYYQNHTVVAGQTAVSMYRSLRLPVGRTITRLDFFCGASLPDPDPTTVARLVRVSLGTELTREVIAEITCTDITGGETVVRHTLPASGFSGPRTVTPGYRYAVEVAAASSVGRLGPVRVAWK